MINKTINLQQVLILNVNETPVEIGFANAQIYEGFGGINFSIQIVNQKVVEENKEACMLLIEEFKTAVDAEMQAQGW